MTKASRPHSNLHFKLNHPKAALLNIWNICILEILRFKK